MQNQSVKQPDSTDQAVFQFRPWANPIALADILLIHSYNAYSIIEKVNGQSVTVCMTLKHIEQMNLPGLIRLHSQYMIPLHLIRAVYFIADKTKHKSHAYRVEVETIYYKRYVIAVRKERSVLALLNTSVKSLREAKRQMHSFVQPIPKTL